MPVESRIFSALKHLADNRVYRDVAPENEKRLPRITFQQVGGAPINTLSGDKPSKKNARMQINCWHSRRDDAMALARQVEDTMRTVTTLAPTVLGAPIAVYEQETGLYGAIQDFSVWFDD